MVEQQEQVNEAYYDKTAGGTGWEGNLEPSANNTYSLGAPTNMCGKTYILVLIYYTLMDNKYYRLNRTIPLVQPAQNISIVTTGGGAVELNQEQSQLK